MKSILLSLVAVLVIFGAGLVYAENLSPLDAEPLKHPNMDSRLAQIYNSSAASPSALSTGSDTDKIRVILVMVSPDAEIPADLGIEIETSYEELIQVVVPVSNLEKVAADENVRFVRMPSVPAPQQQGETKSEGAVLMGSLVANHAGYTGDGIKVAVIDTGFDIRNPEIAGNIKEYRSYDSENPNITGDNDKHGTGSTEIVVDVAPDVELYLYNVGTGVEFFNLVDYLINRSDIDIITMSLSWQHGPFDGTSRLAQKVNEARNSGILWINSAGNSAERHWQGQFSDSNGNKWHNFSGDDETLRISVEEGDEIELVLSWWGLPLQNSQDYNLFLGTLGDDGYVDDLEGIGGTDTQSASQPWPWEVIQYTTPHDQNLYVSIDGKNANRSAYFQLFSRNHDLDEYAVPSTSITNPADATGAIAVGASKWDTGVLEDYSSQGPTVDGRIKPDITGPTCVSTTTYGDENYCGTSAAAPHIAGAAALVMEKHPTWTASEVQDWLESNTRNHHTKSNTDGTGLVRVSLLATPTSEQGGSEDASSVQQLFDLIKSNTEYISKLLEDMGYYISDIYGHIQRMSSVGDRLQSQIDYQYSFIQSSADKTLENERKIAELERAVVMLSSSTRNAGPEPTPPPTTIGIEGKVYDDANNNNTLDAGESGIPNRTILVINLANPSDVNRLTTDSNGDYSIELAAGSGWLVQVEGTNIYSYVTVQFGSPTVTNLGL